MLERSPATVQDAWSAIGPWRMSGPATIFVHGDDWEERIAITRTLDGWEARTGTSKTAIRWWRDSAGILTLVSADVVQKFAVVERATVLDVSGGGGRWLVAAGPQPTATVARRERSSDGRVPAPLPATVLELHVDVGERVERGQPLVTLYAMKMELVCEAPAAGDVESISCQVGELVDADQLLVKSGLSRNSRPAPDQRTLASSDYHVIR